MFTVIPLCTVYYTVWFSEGNPETELAIALYLFVYSLSYLSKLFFGNGGIFSLFDEQFSVNIYLNRVILVWVCCFG